MTLRPDPQRLKETAQHWVWVCVAAQLISCAGSSGEAKEPTSPDPAALLEDEPNDPGPAAASGPEVKEAIAAIQRSDFEAAKTTLAPIAPGSKDPQVHFYLGVAQANTGDAEAGIRSLETALKFDPKLTEASVNLGALLIDAQRVGDALAVTQAALKHAPSDPALLQNQALSLMLTGDPAGAATVYSKLVAETPENEELRFSYAQALLEGGKKDEARVQLKKLTASKSVAVLNSVADLLGRLREYGDCIAAMDAAIAMDGKSELYVRRGVCKGSQDDAAGAQADFKKATEVDPASAPAHYYLGKSLAKTNKPAAKAALDKAVALSAENPKLQAAAKKALAEL